LPGSQRSSIVPAPELTSQTASNKPVEILKAHVGVITRGFS
jgi:hypothetical protein